jgi:uncharacterized membrane protein
MVALACLIVAIIALVRVARLDQELNALRRRLDAYDTSLSRPIERRPPPEGAAHPPIPPPPVPASSSMALAAASPLHGTSDAITIPSPAGAPATAASFEVPPPSPSPVIDPSESGSDTGALERRIGERLLLYAGMVLVVFAVGFFLRYAFEHQWLSPAVRVALGLLGGMAFVIGGQRLARSGYEQYGLFLIGGGFALLFLAVYAAFGIYALIGQTPAFAMLVAIAAAAATLADRNSSQPLALMAVCGGFLAPFLVSTGEDAQVTLFTYDAILIAATMYLARRRGWPALNLASFAFTIVTVAAWMIDAYVSSRYLTTELFLTLYCAMFVSILRETRRSLLPHARGVAAVLLLGPILYHLASTLILFDHGVAFLIYIALASAAAVVGSLEATVPFLRSVAWLGMTSALALWVAAHQTTAWIAGSSVVAVGTWLIFLAPGLRAAARGDAVDAWDLRLVHSAGLASFGVIYVAVEEQMSTSALAAVAAGFAMANVLAWSVLRRRSGDAIHWLGVGCALAAVAVAIGFEGFWSVVMWSAEAAALMWIGVRAQRFWFRMAGLALFAASIAVWIQSVPPEREGVFVVLLNARALSGLFVIALLYAVADAQRRYGQSETVFVERAITLIAAHALSVVLISLEVTSFWEARPSRGVDADLARELMLSLSWAIYAGVLIAIGMRRHYPPIRYFAIALFGVTVLKVFAVDTQELDGIYRVIAYLVVGGVLLGASFLYQRVKRR